MKESHVQGRVNSETQRWEGRRTLKPTKVNGKFNENVNQKVNDKVTEKVNERPKRRNEGGASMIKKKRNKAEPVPEKNTKTNQANKANQASQPTQVSQLNRNERHAMAFQDETKNQDDSPPKHAPAVASGAGVETSAPMESSDLTRRQLDEIKGVTRAKEVHHAPLYPTLTLRLSLIVGHHPPGRRHMQL